MFNSGCLLLVFFYCASLLVEQMCHRTARSRRRYQRDASTRVRPIVHATGSLTTIARIVCAERRRIERTDVARHRRRRRIGNINNSLFCVDSFTLFLSMCVGVARCECGDSAARSSAPAISGSAPLYIDSTLLILFLYSHESILHQRRANSTTTTNATTSSTPFVMECINFPVLSWL